AGPHRAGVLVCSDAPGAIAAPDGSPALRSVEFAARAYEAARGADAIAIVTDWNEFRALDLARLKRLMRKPVMCDLRNLYDPHEVEAAGITYVGVGRGRASGPARRKSKR